VPASLRIRRLFYLMLIVVAVIALLALPLLAR
jgi:hypothetical protein